MEAETEAQRKEQSIPLDWESDDTIPNPLELHTDKQAAQALDDVLSVFHNEQFPRVVEALFTDEAAFRQLYPKSLPRTLKYYRAYIICQLGVVLQQEARRDTNETAYRMDMGFVRLMREFTKALAIPESLWERVETVVEQLPATKKNQGGASPDLIAFVNQEFDVELRAGNYMSVIRHELNGFIRI
jgi:hypothetical protein